MNLNFLSRREFSARLTSLISAVGIAGSAFGATGSEEAAKREILSDRVGVFDPGVAGISDRPADSAQNDKREEVSHTAESIHQEIIFKASRKRVYEALTDAKQFTKVTEFSSVPKAPPAEISREAGGAFTIFGGHIVGRHVELVPNERIVQAWRSGSWAAGDYSIAKFELKEQGAETKLVFDHTGFPSGQGEHLAEGWKMNYWEPLQKYLGSYT